MEKEYYTSYYDVFGYSCDDEKDKKRMFNDYGQNWDRQSFRKDFNPSFTKSKLLHYNEIKTTPTYHASISSRHKGHKTTKRITFKLIRYSGQHWCDKKIYY